MNDGTPYLYPKLLTYDWCAEVKDCGCTPLQVRFAPYKHYTTTNEQLSTRALTSARGE